jgi:Outer membrane protein beta-barrel domain
MNRLPLSPVRVATLALALAACTPAFAAPAPADEASPAAIRPLVGGMLTGTIGADRIRVVNPDGVAVNGSLSGRYEAYAGAEFPLDPNGLAVRLTVGYHVTGPFEGDASEHLTSFPLEATLWYPLNEQLRVDAGIRYAMRNRFSGPGRRTADGINPTPALVAGVGVRLRPHVELDLRYVYQRYQQPTGGDLEASHWGVGLTALY